MQTPWNEFILWCDSKLQVSSLFLPVKVGRGDESTRKGKRAVDDGTEKIVSTCVCMLSTIHTVPRIQTGYSNKLKETHFHVTAEQREGRLINYDYKLSVGNLRLILIYKVTHLCFSFIPLTLFDDYCSYVHSPLKPLEMPIFHLLKVELELTCPK